MKAPNQYKLIILFIAIICCNYKSSSQNPEVIRWVDSVFNSLSPAQRIAQLFIIRAYSDRDSVYNDSITRLIQKFDPGGVCFFKGSPYRQATLTNQWQKIAFTPLLIAIDAENGLGMRLDSAFSFPKFMTLGAISDDRLIYQMASIIAKDCKRMGIQINFAPVVDINCNPLNPVIHLRSFGENKFNVAKKGIAYMNGLQDHGIIATAKHFPGHGDTDSDSHLSLPVIRHSAARLDSTELYPFRELIRQNIDGIMTAHLFIPAYDSSLNTAATLSGNVVTNLLKKELGFKGYAITDALDMKGVTKYFKPGEIELKALLAGNDILLLPQNIEIAVDAINKAADSSSILREVIGTKCKRILELKYRSGMSVQKAIGIKNLYNDLNPEISEVLNQILYKQAITLVQNQNNIIPLKMLDHRKIAVLCIGDSSLLPFYNTLRDYAPVNYFSSPLKISKVQYDTLLSELSSYNLIITGINYPPSQPDKNFLIGDTTISLIDSLCSAKKVILDLFGSPYALSLFKNPDTFEAIFVSYQNAPDACNASGEIIFGGIGANGKLPVTGSPVFPAGRGLETTSDRLCQVLPDEIGIPSAALQIIDSLALSGIKAKAYPGCEVLFAKDRKIFYRKSFGYPIYGDSARVSNDNLYDLASLTKVAATTLAIMKLYESGKIKLDATLGNYLNDLKGSNKEKMTIREIMTHQAGLQTWIPFYKETLMDGKPDHAIYSSVKDGDHPYRVSKDLYIRKDWPDTVYKKIMESPLLPVKAYKYSDLGFYYLKKVVEKISGETFDQYVSQNFYRPLGLTTIGFNPLDRFPLDRIIPTENDTFFRYQLLQGDVHDMGAAMLGGVSGHAGLFSDAYDLAVILQMLLNYGEYGGKQCLLPSTIREFTRAQYPQNNNRRGLGFDKPLLKYSEDGPACKSASRESFGHSGFTGTYIWADPENKLVYVFLSNRIYPSSTNQKISEMNIRTKIHQAMYDILQLKIEN